MLEGRRKGDAPKALDGEAEDGGLSMGEVKEVEERVVSTWLKFGARLLWEEMKKDEFRENYRDTLEWKTELWPRTDGLTRERWQLWVGRLREMGQDGAVDDGVKKLADEAAEVAGLLLRGRRSLRYKKSVRA